MTNFDPTNPQAIFVSNGDDWEGIYINGRLVAQGHTIEISEVLMSLGYEVVDKLTEEGWLEDQGYLPENITDVVFE